MSLQCFQVSRFIVGNTRLPTTVKNTYPFNSQRPDRSLVSSSLVSLGVESRCPLFFCFYLAELHADLDRCNRNG